VFSWCQMRGVPIAFVLAGDTSDPNLIALGSSHSTYSLSKRRAQMMVPGLPFRVERNSQDQKLTRSPSISRPGSKADGANRHRTPEAASAQCQLITGSQSGDSSFGS
jgi:hypothetical protein